MLKYKGLLNLEIEHIQPVPFEHPVREMTQEEYEKLKESIEHDGFISPIVVGLYNKDYYLVDGRHRVKACKELGLSEIPAYVLEVESESDLELCVRVLEAVRKNLNEQEMKSIVSKIDLLRNLTRDKKARLRKLCKKEENEKDYFKKYEKELQEKEKEIQEREEKIRELVELLKEKEQQIKELEEEKEEAIASAIREKEKASGEISEEERRKIEQEIAEKYEKQIFTFKKERKELIEELDIWKRNYNDLMAQKKQIEKAVQRAHEDIKNLVSVGRLYSIIEEMSQLFDTMDKVFEKMVYYGYTITEQEYEDLKRKWEKNIMSRVRKIDQLIQDLGRDVFMVERNEETFQEALRKAGEVEIKERVERLLFR